jgi:hypothetical protein
LNCEDQAVEEKREPAPSEILEAMDWLDTIRALAPSVGWTSCEKHGWHMMAGASCPECAAAISTATASDSQ